MRGESGTEAANCALARRFFDLQDRTRGGPDAALCAPGYQAFIGGNLAVGREGHAVFARTFSDGLPDLTQSVEDVFATGDRVGVRLMLEGTHTGVFFGIPPTGKRVRFVANAVLHVDGGQVTRMYAVFDEAGLLRQLGALSG